MESWLHFLLFGLAITSVLGSNDTEVKAFGRQIFNVVKFPNDACTSSTSGQNGTCYTAAECASLSGTASGTCASSFGVCCVFSLSCGSSSSQNNTYLEQTTYSVTTDASPCTYKICSSRSDVSKIKIDFTSMTLTGPYSANDVYPYVATTGGVVGENEKVGSCETDQFDVASPGHASPPTICGLNTGQHMFVPMSADCVTIHIHIDKTSTSTTRSWSMKITQYEVGSQDAPEANCLQYHTAQTGTIGSFNFDLSETTTVPTTVSTRFHLADQKYDICFRRVQGTCSICYSPTIQPTAAEGASYGLGGSSLITTQTAHTNKLGGGSAAGVAGAGCSGTTHYDDVTIAGLNAAAGTGAANGDYLEIFDMQSAGTSAIAIALTTFSGEAFENRICGAIWGISGATAASTICSYSTPFKVGVHFDDIEALSTADAAALLSSYENNAAANGAGYGYNGFSLSYEMMTC